MLKKNYVLLVIAALVMASTTAVALGPLGAPNAQLRQGQYSVGVDYGYTEHDIGTGGRGTFRTNAFLANLGYGVADNVEIYGLIGMADGTIFGAADQFDASYDFAYGLGTKITLLDQGEIQWGMVTQMSWFDLDDSYIDRQTDNRVSEEVDGFEVKVGVGPTYTAMEGLHIYGGPMLHVLNQKWDDGFSYNDREVGIFAGVDYEIMDNISLLGEYQWTCDMEMVGVSVGFKF